MNYSSLIVLDKERIAKTCPAALSKQKANFLSDRYQHVNTESVIDSLGELGYKPTRAIQDKPRTRDPHVVRHMITFTPQQSLLDELHREVGDVVPQLVFTNSHNGRTKARFRAGFYRLVCSNGLICGTDDSVSELRHTGDVIADVFDSIKEITADMDKKLEVVDHWSAINLELPDQRKFAQEARVIRFGDKHQAYTDAEILQTRRKEDEAPTLWNIFNRVQENSISRSIEGRSAANRVVRSRPIGRIAANIDINAALWNLAQNTADRLAA